MLHCAPLFIPRCLCARFIFLLARSQSTFSSPASEGVPSGSVTPTGGHTTGRAKSDISLSRKAVRVEEVEPDCCAICLDNYSEEDPQIPCRCR